MIGTLILIAMLGATPASRPATTQPASRPATTRAAPKFHAVTPDAKRRIFEINRQMAALRRAPTKTPGSLAPSRIEASDQKRDRQRQIDDLEWERKQIMAGTPPDKFQPIERTTHHLGQDLRVGTVGPLNGIRVISVLDESTALISVWSADENRFVSWNRVLLRGVATKNWADEMEINMGDNLYEITRAEQTRHGKLLVVERAKPQSRPS